MAIHYIVQLFLEFVSLSLRDFSIVRFIVCQRFCGSYKLDRLRLFSRCSCSLCSALLVIPLSSTFLCLEIAIESVSGVWQVFDCSVRIVSTLNMAPRGECPIVERLQAGVPDEMQSWARAEGGAGTKILDRIHW